MTAAPPASPEPVEVRPAGASPAPVFAALTGLTSLSILAQGVLAGVFIDQPHNHGWVGAHNVNGDVATALAVVTAAFALARLRDRARGLVIGSVLLAVLLLAEVGLGHAVTGAGHDGLLAVHIPLALLAFGLTIWLSVAARVLRTGHTDRRAPSSAGSPLG
jgi:hypothetical protein